MDELIYASATALAQSIRSKEVSSEEIVNAYLQRIEAVNPQLNAVVQLAADAARAQARQADAALARGEIKGLLHGVPFTVKDVFNTAGVVSAVGLKERASFAPDQDATVVARMRAAGAILLGKTNCPPGGAGGETDNPVYGRTNNPYDRSRTPGGSSGGEAAIIAAGGSPLGLGSDSGGSIRLPAHYCGIAGLKPTFGRVPCTGVFEHPGGLSDPRSQIGPMSRFVEDLGPALAIISGVDWHDSGVVPMPLGDPGEVAIQGLRLAFFTDDGLASPTAETVQVVRTAAQVLSEAKLVVEEARPRGIEESLEITKGYWRQSEMSGQEIERLMMEWDRFRSAMLTFMADYDLILCPASDRPALPHGTGDDERFSYTLPYSLTGYPCAVVRAGTSPEGLPIGVQVVARPWRDDVALAVAQRIETALGGWQRPPI
jgi:amidase